MIVLDPGYDSFSVMRPSVSLLSWQLLWTLTVGLTPLSGQAFRPVAYVLNLTGTWQLDGREGEVKAGQALDAGSKLSVALRADDSSITIMRSDDLSRTRIVCDNSANNPCRNPIVISPISSEVPANRFKALTAVALSLLLDKPPAVASHFAATLSRGEYVIAEKEDVVMLNKENGVSLTDALPVLPPGRYTVNATKNDGNPALFSDKITHFADGSWQTLRIPTLGLYMVSLTDSDGERRADLLFWVLPSSEYRAAKDKFDAIKGYTSRWKGPNAQADEHLFLRAVLLAMSKPS